MFTTQSDYSARPAMSLVCAACLAMLAFGLYLQHVVGLDPCPMCIVQRYALIVVALVAGGAAFFRQKAAVVLGSVLLFITSSAGAFVAARQSYLQWYPPEIASCGRDFYGMVETFPLKRLIPMIFKGSGDCTKIDWTFLGLSIANWSFLCFAAFALLAAVVIVRRLKT